MVASRGRRNLLSVYLFISGIFLAMQGYPQLSSDSLAQLVSSAPNDSVKTIAYVNYCYATISEPVKVLSILSEWTAFADKIHDPKSKAFCWRKIGTIYNRLNYFDKSLEFTFKSAELFTKINDKEGLANCYNNIANNYNSKGAITNDEEYFDRAIAYHLKCIKLRNEIGALDQLPNSYNNIGLAYLSKKNYQQALHYFKKAYDNYVAVKSDAQAMNMISENLGDTYLKMALKENKDEYFKTALFYYKKIMNSLGKNDNNSSGAHVRIQVGYLYCLKGNFQQGLELLKKGLLIAGRIHDRENIIDAEWRLSEVLEKKGDYQEAVQYLHNFNLTKDTLLNEKNTNEIEQMQAIYQSSQKDREIEKLNSEKKVQHTIILAVIGGLILFVLLAGVIWSRFSIKKRANQQLSQAFSKIEMKNKQITDNIQYAKRIQDVLMPAEVEMQKHFKNFFLYFSPKDIVSGDFYWFAEQNDHLFFVLGDCTGHGVSGALMSMIGCTLLNEIILQHKISDPGMILDQLNSGITKALRQRENDMQSQDDGMDLSVCCINKKNLSELQYATANHTIWIKHKNNLRSLQGDIHSIGGGLGLFNKKFTTRTFQLEPETTIVFCTDGFFDQFGGPNGSKFLVTRFEELLLQNDFHGSSSGLVFQQALEKWKGNRHQTDDVLVAGFIV
jgi:serine phosphatase RsbU (regulator of sigma subunit)